MYNNILSLTDCTNTTQTQVGSKCNVYTFKNTGEKIEVTIYFLTQEYIMTEQRKYSLLSTPSSTLSLVLPSYCSLSFCTPVLHVYMYTATCVVYTKYVQYCFKTPESVLMLSVLVREVPLYIIYTVNYTVHYIYSKLYCTLYIQ